MTKVYCWRCGQPRMVPEDEIIAAFPSKNDINLFGRLFEFVSGRMKKKQWGCYCDADDKGLWYSYVLMEQDFVKAVLS